MNQGDFFCPYKCNLHRSEKLSWTLSQILVEYKFTLFNNFDVIPIISVQCIKCYDICDVLFCNSDKMNSVFQYPYVTIEKIFHDKTTLILSGLSNSNDT